MNDFPHEKPSLQRKKQAFSKERGGGSCSEQKMGLAGDRLSSALAQSHNRIDMTHVGLVPEVECYNVCEPAWNGHLNNLAAWIETGISPLA